MNQFPMLARFNAWANERIYGASARLDDAGLRLDRGAFFGSIHNTLNHLLVVDRLWRGRVEGVDPGIRGLDEILYDDFEELRVARAEEDDHIISLVDGLDETRLEAPLSYRLVSGKEDEKPLHVVLITLFNHQTHHRGQVHAMLTQAGAEAPALDIINFV